jgi:hypothetical protein
MKARSLLTVCLMALALPAGALGASCAPPGNSGVDQYFETVPGAGCNQPPSGGHHGSRGSLSAATRRQLAAQGAAGQAVARLVSSTGPGGVEASSGSNTGPSHGSTRPSHATGAAPRTRRPSAGGDAGAPSGTGRGLLSALLRPIVTGSSVGGLGVLLPLFLAAVLVLVVAVRLLHRRRLTGS